MYKMAGVMAQCGGLECMLNRLAGIKDFKQGRHLLTVSWSSKVGPAVFFWRGPCGRAGRCHVTWGQRGAMDCCPPGPTWLLP